MRGEHRSLPRPTAALFRECSFCAQRLCADLDRKLRAPGGKHRLTRFPQIPFRRSETRACVWCAFRAARARRSGNPERPLAGTPGSQTLFRRSPPVYGGTRVSRANRGNPAVTFRACCTLRAGTTTQGPRIRLSRGPRSRSRRSSWSNGRPRPASRRRPPSSACAPL